jgi:hypothetical protein
MKARMRPQLDRHRQSGLAELGLFVGRACVRVLDVDRQRAGIEQCVRQRFGVKRISQQRDGDPAACCTHGRVVGTHLALART